jgi:hypothetical protein
VVCRLAFVRSFMFCFSLIFYHQFFVLDNTSVTFIAQKIRRFILPPCKERWLTSAVETLDTIIVGDRDGSIHLYFNGSSDVSVSSI